MLFYRLTNDKNYALVWKDRFEVNVEHRFDDDHITRVGDLIFDLDFVKEVAPVASQSSKKTSFEMEFAGFRVTTFKEVETAEQKDDWTQHIRNIPGVKDAYCQQYLIPVGDLPKKLEKRKRWGGVRTKEMNTKCSVCESGNVEPIIYSDDFLVQPGNIKITVAGLEGYRCLDCDAVTIHEDQIQRNHERIEQKRKKLGEGK